MSANASFIALHTHQQHMRTTYRSRKSHIVSMLKGKQKTVHPEMIAFDDINDEIKLAWLQYPEHNSFFTIAKGHILLPIIWLSKLSLSYFGLPLDADDIRERLSLQTSIAGTVAALLLVVCFQAFLFPPDIGNHLSPETGKQLIRIFAILNFFAFVTMTSYIVLSLLVVYPLLQGMRSDLGHLSVEQLFEHQGHMSVYIFNAGIQAFVAMAVLAAWIVYDEVVFFTCVGILVTVYGLTVYLTSQYFIALDPITALHLGLSNSDDCKQRAAAMRKYILDRAKQPTDAQIQNVSNPVNDQQSEIYAKPDVDEVNIFGIEPIGEEIISDIARNTKIANENGANTALISNSETSGDAKDTYKLHL